MIIQVKPDFFRQIILNTLKNQSYYPKRIIDFDILLIPFEKDRSQGQTIAQFQDKLNVEIGSWLVTAIFWEAEEYRGI